MKNILFFALAFICFNSFAQTKHTVIVTNGNFTPSGVTIDVGDTLEFINQGGSHWVDGRQSTFASNPVSFDNQSQSGTGWTYTEVFNTAGNYDYRCGIHTTTMSGTITVQTPAGVNEPTNSNQIGFYPNPATKELNFSNYESIESVAIYSLTGEKVVNKALVDNTLDISLLMPGTYFVKIRSGNDEITKKLVIK